MSDIVCSCCLYRSAAREGPRLSAGSISLLACPLAHVASQLPALAADLLMPKDKGTADGGRGPLLQATAKGSRRRKCDCIEVSAVTTERDTARSDRKEAAVMLRCRLYCRPSLDPMPSNTSSPCPTLLPHLLHPAPTLPLPPAVLPWHTCMRSSSSLRLRISSAFSSRNF